MHILLLLHQVPTLRWLVLLQTVNLSDVHEPEYTIIIIVDLTIIHAILFSVSLLIVAS